MARAAAEAGWHSFVFRHFGGTGTGWLRETPALVHLMTNGVSRRHGADLDLHDGAWTVARR
jgi:hypothetical protein